MISLILYNWEVRDECIKNFELVSNDELIKDRDAGIGSILKTFLHIIDVEYSWFRAIFNKPDIPLDFNNYIDLQSISILSNHLREEIKGYLNQWKYEDIDEKIYPTWMQESYSKEEIFKHLLVHEIHHIGQLSIWARELGVTPANSNFIGRNLINKEKSM